MRSQFILVSWWLQIKAIMLKKIQILNSHWQDQGVLQQMALPPQSPALNMESVWDYMKRQTQLTCPTLHRNRGKLLVTTCLTTISWSSSHKILIWIKGVIEAAGDIISESTCAMVLAHTFTAQCYISPWFIGGHQEWCYLLLVLRKF